jgi:hypothetical protein
MTEIDKREMERLEKDITARLFELEAFSHAMELLFNECDLDYMKNELFDAGLLFATQKRLYSDLHSQVRELIDNKQSMEKA